MRLAAPVHQQPDPPFRSVTRQKVQDIPAQVISAFGTNPLAYTLPNTGYLSRIYIPMRGTIATATGTTPAGNFNGYPYLPYSGIRRIELKNNNNSNICSVSGWGLGLLNMIQRRNSQMQAEAIANYSATNQASTYQAPIGAPGQPNTVVASATAYSVSANYELGITTDDAAMFGLQPLQNNALQTSLLITPANQADVQGNIGGATGILPLTPALTIRPSAEYFTVPPWSGSQPDLRFTHAVWEDVQPILTVGAETVYRPLAGPVYLRVIGIVENNGLPVPYGSITNVKFRHSTSETPYNETYDQHLARCKRAYGFTLPDGMFVYDFTLGYGVPGIVEPRDFVDTSQLTDVQIGVTLSSTLTLAGTSQIRFIREFLAPVSP